MILEDFPVEILALILNGQFSWAAIELWKAGSRSLNRKLARGITNVDLIDTYRKSKSRWPHCLKEFVALQTLSIHRPRGPLGDPAALRSELKKLSSSLKLLRLRAEDLPFAFFPEVEQGEDAEDSDESSEPSEDEHPLKRSKTTETADSERLHLEMWNLDTTFPQLERLELGLADFSENASYPGRVGFVIFSLLPRSLTFFEFPYEFVSGKLSDFSALPPGLKTFRVSSGGINGEQLHYLPKTLTDIGYSLDPEEALCELVRDPQILPNLAHFPSKLEPDESGYAAMSTFMEEEVPWPLSMSELSLLDYDLETLWTRLPRNLTSLKTEGENQPLDSALVAVLPRSLTLLHLQDVEWKGIDVSSWPSSLTQLMVLNGSNFGPHRFHLLPRSLTSLDVGHYSIRLDSDAPKLILDLAALHTAGRDSLAQEMDHWSVLKKRLMAPQFRALGDVDAYIKDVELGALFGLPLTLATLKLRNMLCPLDVKLLLPPNARVLEFSAANPRVDDSNLFHAFAPSFSSHLRATVLGPAPDQRDPKTGLGLASPSLCALHTSNITSLEVSFKSSVFERCGFQYLPPGLQHLNFKGPAVIHLDELKALPSNLKSLTIDFPFSTPKQPWTHLLPRSLTQLDTEGVLFGSDFKDLPPLLEDLRANIVKATLEHARLPRNLRTLELVADDWTPDSPGELSYQDWNALIKSFRPFWRIREATQDEAESVLPIRAVKHGRRGPAKKRAAAKEMESVIFQDTDPDAPCYPASDDDDQDVEDAEFSGSLDEEDNDKEADE